MSEYDAKPKTLAAPTNSKQPTPAPTPKRPARLLTRAARPASRGDAEVEPETAPPTAETNPESEDDRAPPEESTDWVSNVRLKETKLKGKYGEYAMSGAFVPGTVKQWGYRVELEMKPNGKAKSERIAWVQVVRRYDNRADDWAKRSQEQGMTPDRARRTDPKSGFRVDRATSTEGKSPFYGMNKQPDGTRTPSSKVRIGKYGGDNPWMRDTPELYNKDQVEFVTTATDMETGTPFDAIQWGVTLDTAASVATPDIPKLIEGGDSHIAGRDRAIDLWNREIANGTIDKLPTTSNPPATARALSALIAAGKQPAKIVELLATITDPDLRKRVATCYREETDRPLREDLRKVLSDTDRKRLGGWL